jgi:hypothetical protein
VIADLTNKLHAAEVTIANLNITIVNLKHQLAFVSQPAKAPFESRPEDQGRMRKWQIAFSSASLIAITTLLFSWASGHKLTELHEKCENLEHKNVVVENEKYQLQAENSELQESNIVLQGQYDSLEQVYQADKVALSILYHGEMYTFPDTTDRTVACPVVGCSEKKIKMDHANMRQHLDKHPRLRLKEVSSHVMRSRLGLPAVRVLSLA